ncbi:MAG: hypothetical protein AB1896_03780 [Thermodesulfobacteriota bacterium]
MPVERDIHTMLLRVRPLLGVHPDIMRDYLYYRSEIEFQKDRLDEAEKKALARFDRFLDKHRDWIADAVYTPEVLAEARGEFGRDHWWWWFEPRENEAPPAR